MFCSRSDLKIDAINGMSKSNIVPLESYNSSLVITYPELFSVINKISFSSTLLNLIHESTLFTYTNGQQGAFQCGNRGSINTSIFAQDNNTAWSINTGSALADGASNTPIGAGSVINRSYVYNGTTWDRTPGTVN